MPDENVLNLRVSSKRRTWGAKGRGRQWVVNGAPARHAYRWQQAHVGIRESRPKSWPSYGVAVSSQEVF